MNRALGGTTFLELASRDCAEGVRLAAQFAAKVALDLGARVIRVDEPTTPGNRSHARAFLDDGKHGIVLPRDAHARHESIAGLARECDAVVADDAVDLADVRAMVRPPVVARLSLFGRRVDSAGSEFTVMAMSGLLDTVGDPTREPLKLGGHQLAYSAGLSAYAGIAAALLARKAQRGDANEAVRVSLFDTAMWINWKNLAAAAYFDHSPTRPGRNATWQVLRCADGWMALVYVDKDWPGLKTLIGDPRLDDPRFASEQGRARHAREIGDIVEAAFAGCARREIEMRARALRLPLGAVWSPVELGEDPQYRAREVFVQVRNSNAIAIPRLPVRSERPHAGASRIAHRAARAAVAGDARVLAGCRVLDLGILTAGAATSALLADLGAQVVKIESQRYGDPFRVWPAGAARPEEPSRSDCPPFYRATNRNKQSICLDLKSAAGRAVFLRLAARSDVVVENFRRGVMRDLGLAYDTLAAANERIVLASLSSQGETGPEADRVSFGSTLEATGGLAWLTGYPDDAPVISGQILNYADQVVAIFSAGMILTALMEREASGAGLHVQISQRELVTYLVGEAFAANDAAAANRHGNAEPAYVVQQCFHCADAGWIAVSVDLAHAAAVAELVGARPVDARSGDKLSSAIASWISRHPAAFCAHALSARGVAASPVLDSRQALGESRATRDALVELAGGALVKGFPFQLEAMPLRIDDDAHAMGEDTRRVLRDIGGYTGDEVEALVAAGVVGVPPVQTP